MRTKLQKSNQGFTIIEVVIVLAIAALILLIVLLAVPALQRNARNTAIKNDASAIAGGISTFESDNDGQSVKVVADITQSGGTVTIGQNVSGVARAEAKVQAGTVVTPSLSPAQPTSAITPGNITVILQHKCDGTSSTRATAIWYSIETSKGVPTTAPFNNKCLDS